MDYHKLRSIWKLFLFLCAIAIGMSSLLYTYLLVGKLKVEERKKIVLWSEIYRLLNEADTDDANLDLYLRIMENNTTIPAIIVDSNNNLKFWDNLDSVKLHNPKYLSRRLSQMKSKNSPIALEITEGYNHYVYYDNSSILIQLTYYPLIQFGIIFLFICVAYFAFSISRKSEENRVWVGLSKETAHQLGTPISSLLAITEMLKSQIDDHALLDELEKDVSRLNDITERFSKIGSQPATPMTDIVQTIANSLNYIRKRSSDRIIINYIQPDKPLMVPLSEPLFSWVIENICKNALDAVAGAGTITVELKHSKTQVVIDISDTGKGIPKRKYKTIFTPGYTTKSRGWGLGLSLTKRIVEDYHNGRIFVLHSETDKGTTFRIILKTSINITLLDTL